jgi:hypothetical protein
MKLRPIPTYRDHPPTSPRNVVGVDARGAPLVIDIEGARGPVLLLFLSSACHGCADLWEGTSQLRAELPGDVAVVIVVRGPDQEDAAAIAELADLAAAADGAAGAGAAAAGVLTVMSDGAYEEYRVAGPPFLVLVDGHEVKTEAVAWGVVETAQAVLAALAR